MIIRPCCAQKELPPYILENEDHLAIFNTNGDVHFEKLFYSVANILGDNCILTLVTPKVTRTMMRYISLCFERGWIKDFHLRTAMDQRILVCQELGVDIYRKHCICLYSSMVTDASSFFMLKDESEASLAITGYFPPEPLTDIKKKPQSVLHSVLFSRNKNSQELDSVAHAPLAPFHIEEIRRRKHDRSQDSKCEQCPQSYINFETGERECLKSKADCKKD